LSASQEMRFLATNGAKSPEVGAPSMRVTRTLPDP